MCTPRHPSMLGARLSLGALLTTLPCVGVYCPCLNWLFLSSFSAYNPQTRVSVVSSARMGRRSSLLPSSISIYSESVDLTSWNLIWELHFSYSFGCSKITTLQCSSILIIFLPPCSVRNLTTWWRVKTTARGHLDKVVWLWHYMAEWHL